MVFSEASIRSLSGQPARAIRSSREIGWTSLYVQESVWTGDRGEFETDETSDQTVLVFLDGEGVLESWDGRRWNSAFRELGSAGATAPRERDRLRWRTPSKRSVRTASVYLPEIYLSEAREEFRRVGERLASVPVSVLRVQDRLLHSTGGALVAAPACRQRP